MSSLPHFHFITLFPDTIHPWLNASIVGRALKRGLFQYSVHQLRDYSVDKHRTVDDAAYGGGGGMVLKVEPLVLAVESLKEKLGAPTKVICFSPAGRVLNQRTIDEYVPALSTTHLIFICGHYEGIDQRFVDHWVDDVISLGDFVLTGGELPALAVADALIRRIEGALGDESSAVTESFRLLDDAGNPLVEYPHYTRPNEFRGLRVPEVLTNGDHGQIAQWRLSEAKRKTANRNDQRSKN